MICDSPEQKNYIMECIRKYPCNYEIAMQYANTFGQAIQDAQIIAVDKQNEAFPRQQSITPTNPQTPPNTGNGNGADGAGQDMKKEQKEDGKS